MSCHFVLVLFNLTCFGYLITLSRALDDESTKSFAELFLVVLLFLASIRCEMLKELLKIQN